MLTFISELKARNETLFWFGIVNLVLAVSFLVLTRYTTTQVMGVNAWYKPFKFAASTFLFAWAMGWYAYYLGNQANITAYNWGVILLLGFEVVYIALQASRGQLSHYNISTPMYGALFSMMAFAATAVTVWTACLGILFFKNDFPDLPEAYLWGIRLGIVLFVIFSLEGFVMGSRMTHTIGGPDGGPGLPVLNWSYQYGDPRIAHFIGMHALQVLPILAFYLLKDVKWTITAGLLYGALAVFTLVQALNGRPLFKI
jgi:hypothetical protein